MLAAAKGEPTPEGGYAGGVHRRPRRRVLDARPDLLELADDEQVAVGARSRRTTSSSASSRHRSPQFNVHFDVWFSERTLHAKGADGEPSLVDEAVDRLRAQGHVFDDEGAVWVRTTDFGDDKDRVIRRSNGEYTYFAADAAYYLNKGDRGFAHKIYLLGADHHGYVHRLKALAGAAGDDPEKDIEVLIGQLVSINGARLSQARGQHHRDGRPARVARHRCAALLAGAAIPPTRRSTLDPELLRKRTNDNPVFYVQYAHARTHNVGAQRRGIRRRPLASSPPSCSTHETESALLGALQEFPRIVAFAAEVREPHRVARYLEELAGLYHRWYDNCRVIPLGDEPIESRAPHAPVAERRHRPGAAQRTRPARRRRAGTDVGRRIDSRERHPADAAAPDPRAQWVLSAPDEPRPRRRAWPWIVALLLVVGSGGRRLVRGGVDRARHRHQDDPRAASITQLSLPADQQIDVDVEGAVLPQLIAGTLDDVTVSSDDVTFGALVRRRHRACAGHARSGGMPRPAARDGDDRARRRRSCARCCRQSTSFPAETLGLAEPNVTMSTELQLFGVAHPDRHRAHPDGGRRRRHRRSRPASLQLAGARADGRATSRSSSATWPTSWCATTTMCIAQYIPAGVTLTGIRVTGDRVSPTSTSTARSSPTPRCRRTAPARERAAGAAVCRGGIRGALDFRDARRVIRPLPRHPR